MRYHVLYQHLLWPYRKLVFDELLGRLKDKVAKEEKRKRRVREDFTALLKETRDIKADMSWEDAQPLLEKQPEYKGVSPSSISSQSLTYSVDGTVWASVP